MALAGCAAAYVVFDRYGKESFAAGFLGGVAVALAWSFGFPQLRQIQSLDRDAEESRAALKADLERQEKSGPGTA